MITDVVKHSKGSQILQNKEPTQHTEAEISSELVNS